MFAFGFQNFLFQGNWPRRFSSARFFALRDFSSATLLLRALDRSEQTFARELSVHCLRPRILHSDTNTGRAVAQRDCCCNLVDVLTTRPAGARKAFFQISLSDVEPRHALLNRIVRHLLSLISFL